MKPFVLLIVATMSLSGLNCQAQTVYFTVISMEGRASISGFLHSVNDSSVAVVPGQRKRDVSRLDLVEPIQVPINMIKGMVAWKVRGSGTILVEVAAMAALSTSTTFFAVDHLGPRWGLPSSFLTNMGIIFAHTELVTKRLKPTDIFFREKVEDKCIYKDERSLLASNSQMATR